MSSQTASSSAPAIGLIVGSGFVALALAMGIGRFSFTPLMPLMIRDGTLSVTAGADLAVANYVGYFLGAVTASVFSKNPRGGLLIGLLGVVLSTVASTWSGSFYGLIPGSAARAAAGFFSAWTMVCASSWCLAELARRNAAKLGAWIYAGVGTGIALSGGVAWIGSWQPAEWLWLELGLIAALGALGIWVSLRGREIVDHDRQKQQPATSPVLPKSRHLGLVFCYGAFGFGYIVPATFLPTMAQRLVADPLVFGLTWPLFGTAAALSIAGSARFLSNWPRRRVWALAQAVMAVGTALPLLAVSIWTLAASAVLVGGTFMVATMAGLQLAREQAPENPTPLLASLTAAFAVGQIAGPLLVRALGDKTWAGLGAIGWASVAASLILALTAAWLWRNVPSQTGKRISA